MGLYAKLFTIRYNINHKCVCNKCTTVKSINRKNKWSIFII